MKTFTELKPFRTNPDFAVHKQQAMAKLEPGIIDTPIADLVSGFNELPHCFTLQSFSGHFL